MSTAGCTDLNYNPSGGYNDPYYNGGSRDPYYDRDRYNDHHYDHRYDRDREEAERARRERERLEDERRRLEEQRRRDSYRPPPPRHEDHCPPGFSPSENKCSPQERKHGCKDMRLPSGLGCVHR